MYSVLAFSPAGTFDDVCSVHEFGDVVVPAAGNATRLIDLLRSGNFHAVVLSLAHDPELVPATIRTIREWCPRTAIIGVVRWPDDVPTVLHAVRAGLDEIHVMHHGTVCETVARAVAARRDVGINVRATSLVTPYLTPSALRMIDAAIGLARRGPTVSEFAFSVGFTKRTLARRLRRVGLPQPAELLAWVRCLLAAVMLESEGTTVDVVARELRFATPAAFRRTLRRLTGLRPSDVRQRGGPHTVARLFGSAVKHSAGDQQRAS